MNQQAGWSEAEVRQRASYLGQFADAAIAAGAMVPVARDVIVTVAAKLANSDVPDQELKAAFVEALIEANNTPGGSQVEPSLIEKLGAAQVRAQVIEAECNQWKGIAAALVRHFGGPPGTFTLRVPYEVTQLLVDDPCELYVETNEEGLCFTLQPESPGAAAMQPMTTSFWSNVSDVESPAAVADEELSPSGWWYLSFAGDDGFLGGAVVEGTDLRSAIARAHQLGINPGGEVLSLPIPLDKLGEFPTALRNVLLTKAQVQNDLNGGAVADVAATPEQVADYWGGGVVEQN